VASLRNGWEFSEVRVEINIGSYNISACEPLIQLGPLGTCGFGLALWCVRRVWDGCP
jgi:hypothetical protein